MPYRKRGKFYWHRGRKYTLSQIRALHVKKRNGKKKKNGA